MEVDVHLKREADEPWGFRLVGGADYNTPLTIVKILPNSPAESAGLCIGDIILQINRQDASVLTHFDAKEAVCGNSHELQLIVQRGLYDPVLDDFDPIYETIDQEDFDQPSLPNEVRYSPYDDTLSLSCPDLTQARSLTESPFVLPTKPYRPFSTEPLPEIPPIEEPIILNPSYEDRFLKFEDHELPVTRFKLPISEQYDPDGTRRTKQETQATEMKAEVMTQDEIKFMEEMNKEIDLENIENTASSLVDESIERAVSVTKEIQKEIDVELRASMTKEVEKKSHVLEEKTIEASKNESTQETYEQINKKDCAVKEVTELVKLMDKTTEEIVKQDKNTKEISDQQFSKFETLTKQEQTIDERKYSVQQEIDDVITTGSVRRKSMVFEKDENTTLKQDLQVNKEKNTAQLTTEKNKELHESVTADQVTKIMQSNNTESHTTGTKFSASKLLAEQRAYTIGLKTIPNITGSIHSSYHYNLLLKTFFIHLTDVVVALSRFILSEPVFKEEKLETSKIREEKQEISEVVVQNENVTVNEADNRKLITETEKKDLVRQSNSEQTHEIKEDVKQETVTAEENNKELFEIEENERKRTLSGSKMAQMTEKKSEQLIQSMDAVITEFQTKTGIEDDIRDRRSRSRSKIEEEVVKEGDPLEWLSKLDQSKVITESYSSSSTTELSHCAKSTEIQRSEINHESKENKSKSVEGKQTYVAIVEAHVYTNKDAILEEHMLSETASVQSAEETNLSIELSKEKTASGSITEEKQAALSIEKVEEKNYVSDGKLDATEQIVHPEKNIQIEEAHQEISNEIQNIKQDFVEMHNSQTISQKKSMENVTEILTTEQVCEKQIVDKSMNITHDEKVVCVQENSLYELLQSTDSIKERKAVVIDQKHKKLPVVAEEITADFEPEIEHINKEKRKQEVSIQQNIHLSKPKSEPVLQEEAAEIKIIKEEIIEIEKPMEIIEEKDVVLHKKIEMGEICSAAQTIIKGSSMESSFKSQEFDQETSFTAIKVEQSDTKIENSQSLSQISNKESIANISDIGSAAQTIIKGSSMESSFKSQEFDQETSFTAIKVEQSDTKIENSQSLSQISNKESIANISDTKILSLKTETNGFQEEIDTPTPATVPSTPLTDEYLFKLEIPLPKDVTPVPPDPSTPDDEDPHIVKKKLVPHIDISIESKIYDPPLPSPPPGEKLMSPVYSKPGLKGGAQRRGLCKDELLDIERKSSLLASAIDETIKSIEEYKESIGIEEDKKTLSQTTAQETKIDIADNIQEISTNETQVFYNGYAKVETKVYNQIEEDKMDPEDWNKIEIQVETLADIVSKIAKETSNVKTKVEIEEPIEEEAKVDELVNCVPGFKPVQFKPEETIRRGNQLIPIVEVSIDGEENKPKVYKTEKGEIIGTHQGIVDGLDDALVDEEVAKEMGKPGMTEEKIAELISGESEMLREAHVMGLTRVLTSHMTKDDDDSSVDFKKLKPIIESLKDSEVLKALNEEIIKTVEEKKKEERKWTTFMQKPARPVPKVKFGYHGFISEEEESKEPYKVKIVKQPKPKIAPDYKPEEFDTGPLPWEERAQNEPPPSPVEAEDPILIPEELPQFLKAVDPLPENEVPDLEDTGIPLPSEKIEELQREQETVEEEVKIEKEEVEVEAVVEEKETVQEMEENKLAEKLVSSVQSMVDPNASLEQQLAQMRAQLAALAQLPGVIQQTLELVTKQLTHISQQETSVQVSETNTVTNTDEGTEVTEQEQTKDQVTQEEATESVEESKTMAPEVKVEAVEDAQEAKRIATEEEIERMRMEEQEMLEEQRRLEKQKQELEQQHLEQESRQLKQRPTPRVGKPKPVPVFGPLTPQERPMVLPGGRRWRKPEDAYNEQFIAEVLTAQAEIIQGKAKGCSYESHLLPYDERINFMKYEKPPVSLDHLRNSDTYKLIHDMEQAPMRRVDMLTPVIAECDYREKCRSMSPCQDRVVKEQHSGIPQQVQP